MKIHFLQDIRLFMCLSKIHEFRFQCAHRQKIGIQEVPSSTSYALWLEVLETHNFGEGTVMGYNADRLINCEVATIAKKCLTLV